MNSNGVQQAEAPQARPRLARLGPKRPTLRPPVSAARPSRPLHKPHLRRGTSGLSWPELHAELLAVCPVLTIRVPARLNQ